MRTLSFIFVILLLPFSAWAWKPVADIDLSNVSSPASLDFKTGVSAVPAGQSEAGGPSGTGRPAKKFSFYSLLLGNNESVLPSSRRKSEIDDKITENSQEINDISKAENLSNGRTYTIQYPDGQKESSSKPIITDLRPDGQTQLRVYYTKDSSYNVLPKSWVNITPR